MIQTVVEYIYNLKIEQEKEIVLLLHDSLMQFKGMKAGINWGLPFYQRNFPLAYINVRKKRGVELCFWKGRQLSENHSMVAMNGRKLIGGIVFNAIDFKQIEELLLVLDEAVKLDEFPLKL